MPKFDNQPCGVEVPVTHDFICELDEDDDIRHMWAKCDFSVCLTTEAIRDRKLADSRDQGARKLNIMLRNARK